MSSLVVLFGIYFMVKTQQNNGILYYDDMGPETANRWIKTGGLVIIGDNCQFSSECSTLKTTLNDDITTYTGAVNAFDAYNLCLQFEYLIDASKGTGIKVLYSCDYLKTFDILFEQNFTETVTEQRNISLVLPTKCDNTEVAITYEIKSINPNNLISLQIGNFFILYGGCVGIFPEPIQGELIYKHELNTFDNWKTLGNVSIVYGNNYCESNVNGGCAEILGSNSGILKLYNAWKDYNLCISFYSKFEVEIIFECDLYQITLTRCRYQNNKYYCQLPYRCDNTPIKISLTNIDDSVSYVDSFEIYNNKCPIINTLPTTTVPPSNIPPSITVNSNDLDIKGCYYYDSNSNEYTQNNKKIYLSNPGIKDITQDIYGEYLYPHWTLSKDGNIIAYCLSNEFGFYDSPLNCNDNWCYIVPINETLYECDDMSLKGDDGTECNTKLTVGQRFAVAGIVIGCVILLAMCGYIWHFKYLKHTKDTRHYSKATY